MGVPAFFRWLSRKYPSIVVHCVEQKGKIIDGVKVPVDWSGPNPNDVEFDNLYLDMNGIIHPCCHPEDKPAPKDEDEMMILIFEYIDRILSIIRPRRLLYMAIDGVAPRAKMNQQRSRRFRASKESIDKKIEMDRIRSELEAKGCPLPEAKAKGSHFDSNCITPGTPFMFRLAECLRFYIHTRLNFDPAWKHLKVILSDANVPGEGEHKIMDFIRRQRGQPNHDPNTHHVLCGADADLIMLGLATHEPHFTIIREEFKPNKPRPCEMCNQIGHDLKDCMGLPKEKSGEHDEIENMPLVEQEFIFLRLNVLREYLERELVMPNLPFPYDFERTLDDWVFMCFFVGNDFLPHLPSLEIRENAIDRLIRLYKNAVYKTGGYLTDSGVVNLARVQLILSELGKVEDEIFKQRRDNEMQFQKRQKDKKRRLKQFQESDRPKWTPQGQFAPRRLSDHTSPVYNARQTANHMRNQSNEDAAAALKSMLKSPDKSLNESTSSETSTPGSVESKGTKRKHGDSDEEEDLPDDVRLWEDGWKDRYYQSKFDVNENDFEFRQKVGREYVIGLCWVLRYYYQGCASWKWYFPFHYAPFASDFVNIADLPNDFERNTKPFKPMEQLMGVFPAGSKTHVAHAWQHLMYEPESPIIDFYPTDFKIDLNGKKYAWQGVALLPFVDEKRLLKALTDVYPLLTSEEQSRNVWGPDRLFVSAKHPAFEFLEVLYEGADLSDNGELAIELDTSKTKGMLGNIGTDKFAIMKGRTVESPLTELKDLTDNQCISVCYKDPVYESGHLFKSTILKGANFPDRVVKPGDFEKSQRSSRGGSRGGYRPQLGFSRGSGYRTNVEKDVSAGIRMIRHNTERDRGQDDGRYRNMPPPSGPPGGNSYGHQSRNSGNYGSSYGGGMQGWGRNMQSQSDAYQQNMRAGYGTDYGGQRGGNQQGQGYGQGSYGSQRSQDQGQGYYSSRRDPRSRGGNDNYNSSRR